MRSARPDQRRGCGPPDLLNALDLDKASLGIIATTTINLNGSDGVLQLPDSVSSQPPEQSSGLRGSDPVPRQNAIRHAFGNVSYMRIHDQRPLWLNAL